MANYLDKFRGTIAQTQIKQVLNMLTEKMENGSGPRTVEEFNQRLTGLIRELTNTILQPTLKVYEGIPDAVTSSEQYNEMLARTSDDLTASFQEANVIDEVQRDHAGIVKDVMFSNLRAAIAELKAKVTVYDFANNTQYGFGNSISSHFDGATSSRTNKTGAPTIYFVDPKDTLHITHTDPVEADVEVAGKRLVLAAVDKTYYKPTKPESRFNDQAGQSDRVITPSTMSINNIIEADEAYWAPTFLFINKPEYMRLQVVLNYGVIRNFNFIEIKPITNLSLFLESIYYKNLAGELTLHSEPDIQMTGTTGIRISPISSETLVLVFRDENPGHVTIPDLNAGDTLFNIANGLGELNTQWRV